MFIYANKLLQKVLRKNDDRQHIKKIKPNFHRLHIRTFRKYPQFVNSLSRINKQLTINNHEYQTNDILNKEFLQIEKIFDCNLNRYMPAFSKDETSSLLVYFSPLVV